MATKNSPLFVEIGHGLSLMLGLPTIASWKISDRPKDPKPGTFGYNTDTNSLEFWDGANWLAASMSEK